MHYNINAQNAHVKISIASLTVYYRASCRLKCINSIIYSRVRPHFCFGSEIWNWSENFVSLGSEKKPDFTWFTSMQNTKNLKQNRRKNKRKLSEKIEVKQKLSEKKRKKGKKWKKWKKQNFPSKQKLLNRCEAKNLKQKRRKKAKKSAKKMKKSKKAKKAKKSEKSEKSKKSKKIDLNFASLCFASKRKLLQWSEAKNLKWK